MVLVSLCWPIRMVLKQGVIMMTNQNSLETECHYNDQLELFWGRVLLCWPVRMILRQGVIMLTNQNHFETKYHCADQSEALIMLLLLLVNIYIFLCMCMYMAHAWRGEEKLWEWVSLPTMFVLRVQVRESVSLYPPSCLPRSTFLTFLFPSQVFLAPSIERI